VVWPRWGGHADTMYTHEEQVLERRNVESNRRAKLIAAKLKSVKTRQRILVEVSNRRNQVVCIPVIYNNTIQNL